MKEKVEFLNLTFGIPWLTEVYACGWGILGPGPRKTIVGLWWSSFEAGCRFPSPTMLWECPCVEMAWLSTEGICNSAA